MLPPTRRHGRRRSSRSTRRRRGSTGGDAERASARAGETRNGLGGRGQAAIQPWTLLGGRDEWSFVLPVAVVSGLFGASTAMVVVGLTTQLVPLFGGLAREYVLAGAFLALAVGVRVPQRVTMWVCARVWERLIARNRPTSVPDILIARGPADRPLYWIVLSIIALVAGVATALLPLSFTVMSGLYAWLHRHFVWSAMPLDMLHVLLAFLVGFAPLAVLGLALSCAHHMSCRFGRWDIRATGWYLLGAGAGAYLFGALATMGLTSKVLLIASSLPALTVAVLSAGIISKQRESRAAATSQAAPLPLSSDRWPTLLRASIVAVGGGAAVATVMSQRMMATARIAAPPSWDTIIPLALVAIGVGVLLGCRVKPSGTRTIGGFGTCCVLCGGVVVVVSLVLLHPLMLGAHGTMLADCLMLGTFGFTTAYGRQMLMARVASRSSEGSKMTARLLLCVAITVGVAIPFVTILVGNPNTLVILATSLLALGAGLIARDQSSVRRIRHLRIGTVAVSIVVLVLVASGPFSPWRTDGPSLLPVLIPASSGAQPSARAAG